MAKYIGCSDRHPDVCNNCTMDCIQNELIDINLDYVEFPDSVQNAKLPLNIKNGLFIERCSNCCHPNILSYATDSNRVVYYDQSCSFCKNEMTKNGEIIK